MYTDLVGTLKLTVQGEIAKIPLVTIKIYGKDSSIFEYELPLNFQYDDISGPFLAIKGLNEHYFLVHFSLFRIPFQHDRRQTSPCVKDKATLLSSQKRSKLDN